MDRKGFEKYVLDIYGISAEYPFDDSTTAVYRHADNRKWFAVVMDIPKSKLIPNYEGRADIVNLKCDPILATSLIGENAIFPAYHMNKTHWITILLDGCTDSEMIKWLLNISYDLTKKKIPRGKK